MTTASAICSVLSLLVEIQLVCVPHFHLNELFVELALSPNSNEVHVYGWMGSEVRWSLLDKLREHVERVTGVDWAPVSNRIVTCGSVSNTAIINGVYIIRSDGCTAEFWLGKLNT